MKRIVIKGRFPGMNEYIRENRANCHAGNGIKQKYQKLIRAQIRKQTNGNRGVKTPVVLEFEHCRKDRRSDPDNLAGFFHKVFLDALVAEGIIPDDGWKTVSSLCDRFSIDPDEKVIVTIWEDA